MKRANGNPFGIVFTGFSSRTEINFLDLTIYVQENKLLTKTYRKQTEVNSTLFATSCHFDPVKNNIPKGEFIRARRNCTDSQIFEHECTTLHNRFKARGYKTRFIKAASDKAHKITRDQTLNRTNSGLAAEKRSDIVKFITTFCANNRIIRKILRKNWHLLKLDEHIRKYIDDHPTMIYRRAKTIKSTISPSMLPEEDQHPRYTWLQTTNMGFRKCGCCTMCKHAHGPTIKFTDSFGISTMIKENINCKSKFVIYAIICICNKIYVGSTIRELRIRIREHLSSIRSQDSSLPLAVHWQLSHQMDDKNGIKFIGLKKISIGRRGGNRELSLRQQEARTICHFRATRVGLNSDNEMGVFL
ncbi:uncharacterized protein [Ambystoma mexicanum]